MNRANNRRMRREENTIEAMVRIYCRDHHGPVHEYLCKECSDMLDYAMLRLSKCPYQEGKTTCAKCPTHCYRKDMLKRVVEVMRYAGPRMSYEHPIYALFHFIDGARKKPIRKARGASKAKH